MCEAVGCLREEDPTWWSGQEGHPRCWEHRPKLDNSLQVAMMHARPRRIAEKIKTKNAKRKKVKS